ncbi:glycerophosphodiester phosphodiesterase family protein [Shimia sp.]|uniref:glycerophosphodiester phosphodiesterase family protein n=1 Tax=Shimia sp. TaxID=1954381 RepID=UPI0032974416
MKKSLHDVQSAFQTAWTLRWRLVAAHLAFNVVLAVAFVPLLAVTVRLALKFSGQPALSDFDIAYFLLSPVGFISFLILAGLGLLLYVLDVALMMAVALRARQEGRSGVLETLMLILPRAPKVIELGALLTLRVLLICLPFLAISGGAFLLWMSEYDINYYLANKPPEFTRTVIVAGGMLSIMALILARFLIRWTLTLPLVLFGNIAPGKSFALSAERMHGSEIRFGIKVAIWLAISFVAGAIPVGILTALTDVSISMFASSLKSLTFMLILFATLGVVINLLVAAITTGALSVLIVERADWPDNTLPTQYTAPRWIAPVAAIAALTTLVFAGLALTQLVRVKADPNVQIIAHRGAAGSAPENTMASIQQAIDDGADWIEIDVQETLDGQVVVIHDSDFMKIAGVNLKIWDATVEDINDIDIGSWFAPEFSDQRAPMLIDVLTAARDKAGVVIELKYYGHDQKLEQRVIDIVEALDMAGQVKIMSLKYDAVLKMRALRPDWNIGLLASASLGRMWELDVDFLAVNGAAASHRLVRETRRSGKDLFVWTINDQISMSHMISTGVGGLITDEPALARQVLNEHRELNLIERTVLGLAGSLGLDIDTKAYRDESP